MLSQIPGVKHDPDEVLIERKGDRIFYGKWEHSLLVLDGDNPVAVIIGSERKAEGNEQYPENTLYINDLATAKEYQHQGIGRQLLELFLQYNRKIGLKYLDGTINFSVQTNAANWNKHVQNLYEHIGFKKRSVKQYENRVYPPNSGLQLKEGFGNFQ